MKTRLFAYFSAILVILGMTILAGCQPARDEDSELPWASPAGFEGQGPMGMPGPGQY